MLGSYRRDLQRAWHRIHAVPTQRLQTRFGMVEYAERGEGDHWAPYRYAAMAAERIPGAKLLTIDQGGHLFLSHNAQVPTATTRVHTQAAAAIRRESGQERCRFLRADLATVGGLYQTRLETADGYEATLAMNFLGPFTLTSELLPLLRANAPTRCLNVVSAAFKMWKPDPFQDLQSMTSQTIPVLRLVWPLLRLVQRYRSPETAGRRVASLVASPQAAATGQYFERTPTPGALPPGTLTPWSSSGHGNSAASWSPRRQPTAEPARCRASPSSAVLLHSSGDALDDLGKRPLDGG